MFFWQKRSTSQWFDAEQREEIDGDVRRVDSLRLAPAEERGFRACIRRHVVEDVVLFGPLFEVGIEHPLKSLFGSILALMDAVNHDEPVGGRERQWPE